MSDWCILRMAGRSTLRLADGLASAGFEVWTPVETIRRRVPRKNDVQAIPAPIMPTFIFARAAQLPGLFACAADPMSPLPSFSVFRYRDRIPLVCDGELQALRRREDRLRREVLKAGKAMPYRRGDTVKAPDGAFAGMSGVVEMSDGKHTLVMFNGRFGVKIDTFLLRENEIGTNRPIMGAAA